MIYQNQAYYFYKNLQGDVIAITDAKGAVIAKYSYDAWGMCTITGLTSLGTTVANRNLFRYRSYIYDADLKLYYLQSRYYDPETGRFINGDDVRYLGIGNSFIVYNLFAYCANDPVNSIDPDGHKKRNLYIIYSEKTKFLTQDYIADIKDYFYKDNIVTTLFKIKDTTTFRIAWATLIDPNIVIIDLHGNEKSLMDGMGNTILSGSQCNLLPKRTIPLLLLTSCYASHVTLRSRSIAAKLSKRINKGGYLVASDGLVRTSDPYYPVALQSTTDKYYFEVKNNNTPNDGWILYRGGSQSGRYRMGMFTLTIPGLFNYLKKNNLFT